LDDLLALERGNVAAMTLPRSSVRAATLLDDGGVGLDDALAADVRGSPGHAGRDRGLYCVEQLSSS
jgi:hypothetical protein